MADKNVIEVISPGATVVAASQFHTVVYVDVYLDTNPKTGDIYPQGGEYVDGQWESRYAINHVGLGKLMNAAGIKKVHSLRTDDGSDPYLVSWQFEGEWTQPDSTVISYPADYTLDLRGWIHTPNGDVRGARFEKAFLEDRDRLVKKSNPGLFPKGIKPEDAEKVVLKYIMGLSEVEHKELDEMAEGLALRQITQARLFITQLAQTGAMDRVIRKFLNIKVTYSLTELKRPFSVPRSRWDWDRLDAVLGVEAAGNLRLIKALNLLEISPDQYEQMRRLSAPAPVTETTVTMPPVATPAPTMMETAAVLGGVAVPPDPYEHFAEGALEYRKSKEHGFVEVEVLGQWREASQPVGQALTQDQVKEVTGLFVQGRPEFTNHIKKHFKVGAGSSLTWEQLAALIKWKKEGKTDMRWYADKAKDDLRKGIIEAYHINKPNEGDAVAFLEDIATLENPMCLLSVMQEFDQTWEDGHEGLRNLASVLAQHVVEFGSEEFKALCETSLTPF